MIGELLSGSSGVAAALIRAAGWEVLFSAVLFVIVLFLTRLLRGSSPVLRHALWGLVLLRLVLPVDLSTPFSLGSLSKYGPLEPGTELVWPVESPMAAVGVMDPAGSGGGAAIVGESGAFRLPLGLVVLTVWLAGVLAVGGAIWRRRRGYREVMRRADPLRQLRALAVTGRWRRELGVRRPVRLVTSRERHVPFTLGTLRPVIFVPDEVGKHEDPAVLESVIAHELAHIKRWDDLALVFQLLVSALYFFNPVAWASARRMREESERACDHLVLSRGDLSARAYGRSIVAVLKMGLGEAATAPALGSRKRDLRNRLETIMKGRTSSTNLLKSLYPLPTALAFGLFLLPMAGTPAGQAETDASDRAATHPAQQEMAGGWQLQVALTNPLPGSTITARFGPMIHPYTKNQAHHNGIDVKAPRGSQVLAPADGIVEVATAEYSGGADYGIVIIVDHGSGVQTLYAHLASFAVEAGQSVSRGDVLGVQGSTGKSTGPHLHFEVLVNGEHEDPADFVADWRSGYR